MSELISKIIASVPMELLTFLTSNLLLGSILSILIILLVQAIKVVSFKVYGFQLNNKTPLYISIGLVILLSGAIMLSANRSFNDTLMCMLIMLPSVILLYGKLIKPLFRAFDILNIKTKYWKAKVSKELLMVEVEILQTREIEINIKKEIELLKKVN